MAAWLEPRTLLIGLIVLAAGLTEGSANDWVSLAVVDGFTTGEALGALAFGVFVAAMTSMRWFGVALLDRRGRVAVLRVCAVLSLAGLLVFALAGPLWLALVGVVAWGAGAAFGFPVGLSAAADDPRRAPARVSVVAHRRLQRVPRRSAAHRAARAARRLPARAAGRHRADRPRAVRGRARPLRCASRHRTRRAD